MSIKEIITPIINSAKLLEVKVTPEVKTALVEYVICAIDMGSTNPKVEVWKYDPEEQNFVKKALQIKWDDYKPRKELVGNTTIKFLDPQQVNTLMNNIKLRVEAALKEEHFHTQRQLVFAITGFHHDLCITNPTTGDAVVLLDDPSPQPQLNEEQIKILTEQLQAINKNFEEFTTHPTSLAKILWLQQNQAALATLFNRPLKVPFRELKFSVTRGLIAQRLMGISHPNLLPPGERADFGVGLADLQELTPNRDRHAQPSFLSQIGLSIKQVLFGGSKLMAGLHEQYGNVLLFDENDLPAELTVIAWLMHTKQIANNGIVVSVDSVSKIIGSSDEYIKNQSHHEASGTSYSTQRMGANINKEWIIPLALESGEEVGPEAYKRVDRIIKELVEKKTKTPYFYLPTENGAGIVLTKNADDATYNELTLAAALHLDDKEKHLVMLAVVQGAAFGIRQKIDHVRESNDVNATAPVFFYGGALSYAHEPDGKAGWQQVFTQAMPKEAPVNLLSLPSGATAAAFCALQKLLPEEKNAAWQSKFKEIGSTKIGIGGALDDQYQAWLEAQSFLIVNQQASLKGYGKFYLSTGSK